MSSIEYRQRLRDRKEQTSNLGTFKGQEGQATHQPVVEDLSQVGDPPELGNQNELPEEGQPESVATPEITTEATQRDGEQVVDTPTPQTSNAVQPQGEQQNMTPQQMREQAATTAQTLAQLDQDAYQQALADLETQNPTFYAIVVDELNNMAAAAEKEEGDGFDLSGIAGGGEQAEQDAQPTNDQQPESQEETGDTPAEDQQTHE